MENVKPLKGRLFIEPLSDYKLSSGGVWLATSKKDIAHHGKVLAAGDAPLDRKGKTLSWPYKVGDIVHWKKYSYEKWRDHDMKLKMFLKREEILAYERDGKVYASNDFTIVHMDFEEKVGSFYVPENRQVYTANFTGKVISVGLDCKFDISEGDSIYIMRIEGGGHEGFQVRTDNGVVWAIRSRWVFARKEE